MSFPPQAPNNPVITFSPSDFQAQFPEFAALSTQMLQAYFVVASTLFANSQQNLAGVAGGDLNVLTQIMNFATAHVAWLQSPKDLNGNPTSTPVAGQSPNSGLVGRIASAAEGSVNVSTEWKGGDTADESFWTQTQYGALFWTMTSSARVAWYSASAGTAAMRAAVFPPGWLR